MSDLQDFYHHGILSPHYSNLQRLLSKWIPEWILFSPSGSFFFNDVFVSCCILSLVTVGRSWHTGKFCNTIKTIRLGLRLSLAVDQNCFYLQLS